MTGETGQVLPRWGTCCASAPLDPGVQAPRWGLLLLHRPRTPTTFWGPGAAPLREEHREQSLGPGVGARPPARGSVQTPWTLLSGVGRL